MSRSDPVLKQCTSCGEWKHRKDDFLWRKHKRNYGRRIYYYPMSICRLCAAKKSSAYREKLKSSGRFSAAQDRWEANRDREHQNYTHRVRWRRLHGTKFDQAWKRYRHEIRSNHPGRGGHSGFSASAVVKFIEDGFIAEYPVNNSLAVFINGFRFSDADKRNYRRWKNGETQRITLATLDEWATRYELPFWELEEAGRLVA